MKVECVFVGEYRDDALSPMGTEPYKRVLLYSVDMLGVNKSWSGMKRKYDFPF